MRTAHPHTRFRRLTAVVWALLFLVTGAAEGFGAHVCPHHDPALAALAARAAVAAPAAASAAEHAGHHDEQPAHAGCTCVGACQAGGAVLLPPTPFGVAAVLPGGAPALARTLSPDERLPGRTPHTLPFAQAPPAFG